MHYGHLYLVYYTFVILGCRKSVFRYLQVAALSGDVHTNRKLNLSHFLFQFRYQQLTTLLSVLFEIYFN